MEFVALAAVFLFVYVLVSRLAKRGKKKSAPSRAEAAIETWAKAEVARLLAARLDIEAEDMATTLDGNPDPDIVTKVEKLVSGVEVVFARALGSTNDADVRVEVRLDNGGLERSVKRIAFSELPDDVREEFAKSGTAHVYRPWSFPWQR
ncbi:MAG: hypothetical protein HOW73_30520 [Polyangiaceae bacterium]|nr:hypothetical protein [Polyangiaceae bacterium]